MGDDDWLMVAGSLEGLAELIRETVDAERPGDTTTALRAVMRNEKAAALVRAAVTYGKPKGWTANAEPVY
jgi:hypothetical protein